MRYIVILGFYWFSLNFAFATPSSDIVAAARDRTNHDVRYTGQYVKIDYPMGDVSSKTGVCTDVVIRTYRAALGFDFQKAVHEDMRAHFGAYPKIWGLSQTDRNIDHRRVPNLETYLQRQGAEIALTDANAKILPGDILTWRLGGNLPHIGIVSNKKSRTGRPMIIHNIGAGPVEDDLLGVLKPYKHYRFTPKENITFNKTSE